MLLFVNTHDHLVNRVVSQSMHVSILTSDEKKRNPKNFNHNSFLSSMSEEGSVGMKLLKLLGNV